MNNSLVDFKEPEKSTKHMLFLGLMVAKRHVMNLLIYGIAFTWIVVLLITASTLLNDRHLHVSMTLDDKDVVVVDLRKNH